MRPVRLSLMVKPKTPSSQCLSVGNARKRMVVRLSRGCTDLDETFVFYVLIHALEGYGILKTITRISEIKWRPLKNPSFGRFRSLLNSKLRANERCQFNRTWLLFCFRLVSFSKI